MSKKRPGPKVSVNYCIGSPLSSVILLGSWYSERFVKPEMLKLPSHRCFKVRNSDFAKLVWWDKEVYNKIGFKYRMQTKSNFSQSLETFLHTVDSN